MRVLVAAVAALMVAVVPGCLDFESDCPDHAFPDALGERHAGALDLAGGVSIDTTRGGDFVDLLLNLDGEPNITGYLEVGAHSATVRDLSDRNDTAFLVYHADGQFNGDGIIGWQVSWDERECAGSFGASGGITLTANSGEVARAGVGVQAWYAGFWENGTLFDTNIKAFDQSAWPRASWYAQEPYEPIPVYVYDQDRSEQPPHWKSLSRLVGRPGTPVDDAVLTATGTIDTTVGLGYFTTIKGFNDGLKDLSTAGARVVRMEAADAYPEPIEGAPGLGGSPLVFYIVLENVDELPCIHPATPVLSGICVAG